MYDTGTETLKLQIHGLMAKGFDWMEKYIDNVFLFF